MDQKFDVLIVGAGIVGLATAYQMLKKNPKSKIAILEKENRPCLHQSGRNSGVLHTGVYYKPGSLKAKNCLVGRRELLEFCERNRVSYEKVKKVIVATDPKEYSSLEEIYRRGVSNGIPGIELICKEKLKEIEPYAAGLRAILVPECHIVHFPDVAKELQREIKEMGGEFFFSEPVLQIREESGGCIVVSKNRIFKTLRLINCAGLHSDRLAARSLGKSSVSNRIIPFRGEYYELVESRRNLVKGLIYPVPNPEFPFLGVHLTRMINGHVEAGPNAVLAFAREGYKKSDIGLKDMGDLLSFKGFWNMAAKYWKAGCYEMARSFSKALFLRDLQRLVPEIRADDLIPGARGIRAQVVTKEGKLLDDFAFVQKGRAIHVLNAPSPAASASFSIGRTIAEMAEI